MNLTFNELSIEPYAKSDIILAQNLFSMIKVFSTLKEQGFDHLVFPFNLYEIKISTDTTFYEWIKNIPHGYSKELLLSVIKKPFDNELLENQYNEVGDFYFSNEDLVMLERKCFGLTTAYMLGTLTLSMQSHLVWCNKKINFVKLDSESLDPISIMVYNIFSSDVIADEEISRFIENLGEVELIETNTAIGDKIIKLRDDHGKDILEKFAKKLINSPYVVNIINSTPFNPHSVRFIRKVSSKGILEITLFWEDAGYGLVIQTTGRNYRETEEIARLLEQEYSL